MSKFLIAPALLLLVAVLGAYGNWTEHRSPGRYLVDLRSSVISDEGTKDAGANLLVIRPELFPSDYQSPAHLRLKLVAILDKARAAGLINEHTVVALPDHIGTWLVLSGEKTEIYQARSLREARSLIALSNLGGLVATWLASDGFPGFGETLLRMKAERMVQEYLHLFGNLARDYRINLLAGSLLLPGPHMANGQLRSGKGALYNVSLAFGQDGKLLGPPYLHPWPGSAVQPTQEVRTSAFPVEIQRSISHTQIRPFGITTSMPLFLRGRLWSLEGLTGEGESAERAEESQDEIPGSHLANLWASRQAD